ncbi:MAG: ATP synthase F0 subunit B [Desulfatitalea sp.]|nr:ATP synthase F0 subunit B [Desulfatitalea sp.]NNJ98823.1 ATP synthase F0 subunit B [Desulfatitalea sp.]
MSLLLRLGIVITWALWCGEARAEDATGFSRADYDLIMRWFNFAILVFVLIRYGRRPIMGYLKDTQEKAAHSIRRLEEEKKQVEAKIIDTRSELAEGEKRLDLIKDRIITEGHRRKETLIDEAKQESAIILAGAQHKIDALIRESHRKIRTELIDMSAELAVQKLPGRLTAESHTQLLNQWIDAAAVKGAGT